MRFQSENAVFQISPVYCGRDLKNINECTDGTCKDDMQISKVEGEDPESFVATYVRFKLY